MEDILHQFIGSLSRYLHGFIHLTWFSVFLPSTVLPSSCLFQDALMESDVLKQFSECSLRKDATSSWSSPLHSRSLSHTIIPHPWRQNCSLNVLFLLNSSVKWTLSNDFLAEEFHKHQSEQTLFWQSPRWFFLLSLWKLGMSKHDFPQEAHLRNLEGNFKKLMLQ